MATAQSTTPFLASPSATSYPPPPFYGGYYYPPPFPYAAAYPYTLSAAAYPPPPGFFPTPPPYLFPPPVYGPSTYPPPLVSGGYYSAPPTFLDAVPNPHSQVHAPPSESPSPPDSQPSIPSRPLSSSPDSPRNPMPVSVASRFHGDLSLRGSLCGRPKMQQRKEGGRETEEAGSTTPRKDCVLQTEKSGNATPRKDCALQVGKTGGDAHPVPPDYTSQGRDLTKENGAGDASISDEKLVHKHGPGLVSMANNVPDHSFVRTQATSTPIAPGSTTTRTSSSRVFSPGPSMVSVSAPTVPSSAAYVAPKVFDEMPTTKSCPRPCGSALHYYQEQVTSVQSTFVTDGNSNLSERISDGRPQPYGLSNLNHQTVVLADGTERSYYALPENYSLQRAVSELACDVYDESDGCSNEFVQAFPGTPEQMSAVHGEKSEGDSTEFVNVFVSTLGQQNYEENQEESEHLFRDFRKTPETEQTSADMLDYTFKQQQQNDEKLSENDQQLRDPQLNVLVIHETRTAWDPGASTPPHSSNFNTSVQQLKPPPLNVLRIDEPRNEWHPGATEFYTLFPTAEGATELNAAILLVLAVKCSPGKAKLQWDPGIAVSSYIWLNILTGCSALDKQLPYPHITVVAAEPNHYYLNLFMHSVGRATTRQVAEQRHLLESSFKVVMMLNGLGFTDGQPAYMSWDPGILDILDMMLVMGKQSVVTASGSSNIEGITSYTRTRCFIIHQLEFVHQQPINENFKTKCLLLSSKKGIQIWDIDTFFTTFLPP